VKNKALSEDISRRLLEVSRQLNESVAVAQGQCSDEEFNDYRRHIGMLMGNLYADILRPLWQEHPDLKPSEME
jgi:hypothetical protein